MELIKKSWILQRNDEPYPVTTEYENRFGNKVILPAHSTLFQEVFDTDGFPIYESLRNEYYDENANEDVLTASEVLEKKIEMRQAAKDANLDKKPRVVAASLFFRDHRTGEPFYVNEEELKTLVDTTTNWQIALGMHDKDQYLEEDEKEEIKALTKQYHATKTSDEDLEAFIAEYQTIFAGNQKGRHIHIDVAGVRNDSTGKRNQVRLSTLCKKLRCRTSCIKFIKPNGNEDGFLDQIRYLTHETEQAREDGKTVYPQNIVYANFDWEKALEERESEESKYGKSSPSLWQKWKHDVMLEGKTLKSCEEEDWDLYSDKKGKLEELRQYYLLKKAPTPPIRLSYYIEAVNAEGGEGKTQCAKCFARTLAHDEYGAPLGVPFEQLDDYIYFVTDAKVSMQHYDGQPIILFNDFKAGDMITAFKSREALKNFLEPYPEKTQCDIKYGDTVLIPKFVIINGIQSYEEFIDKLASIKNGTDEEESKQQKQFDRRFFGRIIIDSTVSAMRLLVNGDYLDSNPERENFKEIKTVRFNVQHLLRQLDVNNEDRILIEKKVFHPILNTTREIAEVMTTKPNVINEELAAYGEPVNYDELISKKAQTETKKNYTELSTEMEAETIRFRFWLMSLSSDEIATIKNQMTNCNKDNSFGWDKFD